VAELHRAASIEREVCALRADPPREYPLPILERMAADGS